MMLAAARRETSSAPTTLSPAADAVTNSLAVAHTASPTSVTGLFQSVVYAPLHTIMEGWIESGPGGLVDGLINTVARSNVIGNGTVGTAGMSGPRLASKSCSRALTSPQVSDSRIWD
ncbi:MAG: hypothetical protein NVS4B6_12320 [Mycobacterium sp.]